ncbi:hypothetical protein Hanom_Chr05g00448151 [Helianthus anomalus]
MGFPGWELGWILLLKRCYSYLRIYQTIDHRPQVSQDTLRKAYATQIICHMSPGSGKDTLRKAYVTQYHSLASRFGRPRCVKPT